MIVGIGHDLTDVARVAEMVEGRLGEKFARRVLTEKERELAKLYRGARLHQFTAGRFAAKEAISKAFGCGIGAQLNFTDMDIKKDEFGKPLCRLSEAAWARLGYKREELKIHITITHEREMASAFAVVERINW